MIVVVVAMKPSPVYIRNDSEESKDFVVVIKLHNCVCF